MPWSLIFLAAVSLTGCKNESGPTTADEPAAPPRAQPTQSQDGPSADLGSPTIKLVEPGKEPRRALRWSPVPGLEERLKIRVDTEIDARVAILDAKQAPQSVTFELTVRTNEAVREGTAAFSFAVDNVRAHHAASVPPKARKAREEARAAMRGLEGGYRVDSVGTVQEVLMNLPPDASREVSSLVADLKWALRQLGASFPSEAIGTGAEWTVDHRVKQDGVDAKEVSRLEIIKLGARLVTIKKDVRQSAAPQTFRNPGSTVDVELVELRGDGTGEIAWDLTRLFPHSAKMTSALTKRMTYPFEGKRVEATMVTRRTLLLAGK